MRNFEITVRRKDGTLLAVAQSCFATRDAERTALSAIRALFSTSPRRNARKTRCGGAIAS